MSDKVTYWLDRLLEQVAEPDMQRILHKEAPLLLWTLDHLREERFVFGTEPADG